MPVREDLLQVSEANIMKLSTISTAIVLAGIVGVASAAGQEQVMPTVTAVGPSIVDCTPPNDTTGHACDAFNQLVRANFTHREIGMLFGRASSYPELRRGGIDRLLQRRYRVVMQEHIVARQKARRATIVTR